MPGAEGEQAAPVGDRVGDEGAGGRDGLGVLVPHALEQADRGVEELLGQLALAHRRSPFEVSSASTRRGSRCGLDQRAVNTARGPVQPQKAVLTVWLRRRGTVVSGMRQN
ncbi:hypothetical protein SAVCW2_41680 [Streptomyces avermitilis]|uniref:Uncharacterized protein n=1 Tax=Streptomyces avermitilis TaxID=33903 RepID=A0A499VG06_STRAX|nr:hypothetical protein SAVMC3_44290 [Streptomyces avermitilis]GDY84969.1 hypothetical protein SAVCW2_41680 [Streptomyces avermitilis]